MARLTPRKLITSAYRRWRHAAPAAARFALDGMDAALRAPGNRLRHLDLTAAILRQRFRPGQLFVGWLLHGDENDGASRIRALLPHAVLRSLGVNSVVLRKPRRPWLVAEIRAADRQRLAGAGLDVLVFERVHGPDAEALARAVRGTRTRTVFATGDLIRTGMPELVDWVVVASEALQAVAPGCRHKMSVIEGAIDAPPGLVKDYARPPAGGEIRVVWVGYPGHLHTLAPVREALRDPRLARYRLVTISRGPEACIQWDRHRVHRHILACDIAVLPSAPTEWYEAKPNSRMTMFKALGLPIVASPVASYLVTLSHGSGCYFARNVREWADCLATLADLERRRAMGLAERERVLTTYGVEPNARRWLALFERLAGRAHEVPGAAHARPETR